MASGMHSTTTQLSMRQEECSAARPLHGEEFVERLAYEVAQGGKHQHV